MRSQFASRLHHALHSLAPLLTVLVVIVIHGKRW
jgi:hypothetical protein